MIVNDNIVNVLLVGNTSVGKSEFILSFIDENEKIRIPASSAYGQTTRVSMEYSICFNEVIEPQVEITFKSKKEFAEERMDKLKEYFNNENNNLKYFKDEKKFKRNSEELMNFILHDSAFFDCIEFGKEISKDIDDIFNNSFKQEFWNKVDNNYFDDNYSKKSSNNNNNEFDPNTEFENYFGKVYEIIIDEYKKNTGKVSMEKMVVKLNENIDLQPYLKAEKESVSYSSLVKNIQFAVNGKTEYKNTLINNKVDMVKFIDTYGLGHEKPYGESELKSRYDRLLRTEYPNINDVFFLRTASSNDTPTDIATSLRIIYCTKPHIMSFIIFTKIDEKGSKYFSEKFKAKNEIANIKGTIIKDLLNKEEMSEDLAEFKINVMVDKVCGYASKIDENCVWDKNKILEENEKIFELFRIIRNKEYLVHDYIPINKLTVDNLKDILTVDKLFESHDIYSWLPSRTKGAVYDRFCSNELGFCGKYNTTYSNYYEDDLNKRFANIKNILGLNEDIFQTVAQLFTVFANTLSRNSSNYISDLDNSSYSKEIINILYNNRKSKIEEFKKTRTYDQYLDNVFDFSKLNSEQKSKIQDIIKEAYEEIFLGNCREHNARILAEKIKDDTTSSDEEKLITEYYKEYDNYITDDEKESFEEMVANYSN